MPRAPLTYTPWILPYIEAHLRGEPLPTLAGNTAQAIAFSSPTLTISDGAHALLLTLTPTALESLDADADGLEVTSANIVGHAVAVASLRVVPDIYSSPPRVQVVAGSVEAMPAKRPVALVADVSTVESVRSLLGVALGSALAGCGLPPVGGERFSKPGQPLVVIPPRDTGAPVEGSRAGAGFRREAPGRGGWVGVGGAADGDGGPPVGEAGEGGGSAKELRREEKARGDVLGLRKREVEGDAFLVSDDESELSMREVLEGETTGSEDILGRGKAGGVARDASKTGRGMPSPSRREGIGPSAGPALDMGAISDALPERPRTPLFKVLHVLGDLLHGSGGKTRRPVHLPDIAPVAASRTRDSTGVAEKEASAAPLGGRQGNAGPSHVSARVGDIIGGSSGEARRLPPSGRRKNGGDGDDSGKSPAGEEKLSIVMELVRTPEGCKGGSEAGPSSRHSLAKAQEIVVVGEDGSSSDSEKEDENLAPLPDTQRDVFEESEETVYYSPDDVKASGEGLDVVPVDAGGPLQGSEPPNDSPIDGLRSFKAGASSEIASAPREKVDANGNNVVSPSRDIDVQADEESGLGSIGPKSLPSATRNLEYASRPVGISSTAPGNLAQVEISETPPEEDFLVDPIASRPKKRYRPAAAAAAENMSQKRFKRSEAQNESQSPFSYKRKSSLSDADGWRKKRVNDEVLVLVELKAAKKKSMMERMALRAQKLLDGVTLLRKARESKPWVACLAPSCIINGWTGGEVNRKRYSVPGGERAEAEGKVKSPRRPRGKSLPNGLTHSKSLHKQFVENDEDILLAEGTRKECPIGNANQPETERTSEESCRTQRRKITKAQQELDTGKSAKKSTSSADGGDAMEQKGLAGSGAQLVSILGAGVVDDGEIFQAGNSADGVHANIAEPHLELIPATCISRTGNAQSNADGVIEEADAKKSRHGRISDACSDGWRNALQDFDEVKESQMETSAANGNASQATGNPSLPTKADVLDAAGALPSAVVASQQIRVEKRARDSAGDTVENKRPKKRVSVEPQAERCSAEIAEVKGGAGKGKKSRTKSRPRQTADPVNLVAADVTCGGVVEPIVAGPGSGIQMRCVSLRSKAAEQYAAMLARNDEAEFLSESKPGEDKDMWRSPVADIEECARGVTDVFRERYKM